MSWIDGAVILLYAALLLTIGWRAGRGHQSSSELTLGGRRLPTWAVMCSMSATELSAATFIGVPHAAYTGDWSYLQLAIGALLGKCLLARYVIPLYHALGVVTVYGFLRDRFGHAPQRAAAIGFIIGRILASGVRLFIAALAVAAVTGTEIELAILFCGLIAGVYTLAGGIRAVIWTDTLQAGLLLSAALACLAVLASRSEGGLPGLLAWAEAAGRSRILHIDPVFSATDTRAIGVAVLGAFFLTLATHATDHDMVQRLLTTRDGRSGGRALLGSALLNFPLTLLFLSIGTGLAWLYQSPPDYDISDAARILPVFALHELPAGLRGLLFAGLFAAAMSSLDSAICAIATTWVSDIRPADEGASTGAVSRLRVANGAVTLLLIGAAIGMARYHAWLSAGTGQGGASSGPNLVEFALSSMTILYGGLLGIFALGFCTRGRGSPSSVVSGLVAGGGVGLALFLHPLMIGHTALAWAWWIPISSLVAFSIAAAGRREACDPDSS